jgi:hypothetical protein
MNGKARLFGTPTGIAHRDPGFRVNGQIGALDNASDGDIISSFAK